MSNQRVFSNSQIKVLTILMRTELTTAAANQRRFHRIANRKEETTRRSHLLQCTLASRQTVRSGDNYYINV